MSLALAANFSATRAQKLSLAEELQAWGVPVLPAGKAPAHMRDTIQTHRVGIYKFFGPFLYLIAKGLNGALNVRYAAKVALGMLAVFLVSAILAFLGVPYAGYVLGSVVALVIFVLLFDWFALDHRRTPNFANAAKIWMRIPLETSSEQLVRSWSVPERLIPRVMRAGKVPEVRVSKLIFGSDPLIEVSRTGFFFVERVHIGGWDTGVPEIDNF